MKIFQKLILIGLLVSCEANKSFEHSNHNPRSLSVFHNTNAVQIDVRKNTSLDSREAIDGLVFEDYTIWLADEINNLREVYQDLNISSSDTLIINDVYGDFELHVKHSTDSNQAPKPNYFLEANYIGSAQDDSISLNLENKNYAYILVYSENLTLNSVTLNQINLFEESEHWFYAYVDVRFQPYILKIEVDSQEITRTLENLEANIQYEYKVSRQSNDHHLELLISSGFDRGIIKEDLDVGQTEGVNLIANGSFEANWSDSFSPSSWDLAEEVYKDSLIVSDGVYSAKQIGGTHSLIQVIDINPGKNYEIRFDYFIEEGDGTDARLWGNFVDTNGDVILDIRGDSSYLSGDINNWNTFTKTFQAPNEAAKIVLDLRVYSQAIVYWDNIWIVEN